MPMHITHVLRLSPGRQRHAPNYPDPLLAVASVGLLQCSLRFDHLRQVLAVYGRQSVSTFASIYPGPLSTPIDF